MNPRVLELPLGRREATQGQLEVEPTQAPSCRQRWHRALIQRVLLFRPSQPPVRQAGTEFYSLFSRREVWGSLHPVSAPSPVFLSRQLIFPDLVEGLVLINIDPNGKGWIDWAATKVSVVHLGRAGVVRGSSHLASTSTCSSLALPAHYLTRCYPTSSAR